MKKNRINIHFIVFVLIVLNALRLEVTYGGEQSSQTAKYNPKERSNLQPGLKDSLINLGFREAQKSGDINGIVIYKNGIPAAEKYFNNTKANTVFEIKSVTKSFTSALIGIIIEKGYITIDTKLTDILTEYKGASEDPRIDSITVRHLLTMTGGIKSDNYLFSLYELSSDFVGRIIACRLDTDPGKVFRYSDVGVHLLSAIITKKTKQSSSDFARASILADLNINLEKWDCDPQRISFGGAGIYFTLKDMSALGVLYLNKGIFNAKQVVSKEWISQSLTDYTGWKGNSFGKMNNLGYGYLWWLGEIAEHRVFAAIGYGGQMIVCIPDLNMVIASSAPSEVDSKQAEKQRNKIIDIIAGYFIPAAL